MTRCEHCEIEFVPNKPAQRFCSQLCVRRRNVEKIDTRGPRNNRYNGGFSRSPDGRTLVCTRDGGYVYYSRIVIEDALGRSLTADEIVHHVNGDRADDRLDNLQVTTRAEHARMHRDDLLAARGISRTVAA